MTKDEMEMLKTVGGDLRRKCAKPEPTVEEIVNEILEEAREFRDSTFQYDAVNWAAVRCSEVEIKVVVAIDEASPDALCLREFVKRKLADRGFEDVEVITEW